MRVLCLTRDEYCDFHFNPLHEPVLQIKEIAVIESGPMVERRQAYVIVRHEKYGPAKKGGGKKSKVSANAGAKSSVGEPFGHSEEPQEDIQIVMDDENRTGWSVSDSSSSSDDFRKELNSPDQQTRPADPGRTPPFGNYNVPPLDRRNQRPSMPSGPVPSFGRFSGPEPSSPGQGVQKNNEVNRYASSQNQVPRGGQSFAGTRSERSRQPDVADKVERRGFGVFSR